METVRGGPDRLVSDAWGKRYGLAFVSVAASTLLAMGVGHINRQPAAFLFLPAILFTLWYCGFGPSLFATVLSALAFDYFITPPLYRFSFHREDLVKEILFVGVMGLVSWALERQRKKTFSLLKLQSALLESTNEAILITNAAHHVIYWNRGAERLYGWTKAEAEGRRPAELLETRYPVSREQTETEFRTNGYWQGRLVRKKRSGEEVVTESSWTRDEETEAILQTDVDITARSHAEDELQHVLRALNALSQVNQTLIHAESEEQLMQRAVEIITQVGGYPLAWIGVPENDPERSVKVAASAGAAKEYIAEVKITWKDEPLGRGPTGTALREGRGMVIQDYSSNPASAPWREIAGKYGIQSVLCQPLTVRGRPVAALMVYAAEKDAFGERETSLFVEMAGDLSYGITTLRVHKEVEEGRERAAHLEAQLQQSQKLEAVGRLAGGIAHDFNNLLMVIMAQMEMLKLELKEAAPERASAIMSAAKRAADLTAQLLAFSRKQAIQPTVMTLNELVSGVSDMVQRLVGEDVDVRIGLQDGPWPVKIDRSQFAQVIMNLVVNARDAMPDGGLLTLETTNCEIGDEYRETHQLVPPGKYAMLAVGDTGMGMSADVQEHLFEPFFTTKEVGKGTGLGLSMIYGIVRRSNGFIWVYSEEGKGTCFKIYLPVTEADEGNKVEEAKIPLERTSRTATILVVEDDDNLRKVIAAFLESGGHKALVADGPEEARRIATEQREKIDLIVTDVVMKGGNGKQLVEQLHEIGYSVPVIFMSGYTSNVIVHHGVLDPNVMFLQKPFSRVALLDKVDEALRP